MNVENICDQIPFNKLIIIAIPILLIGPFIIHVPVATATGYSTYCSIGREVRIDHPITWDVNEDYSNPKQFSFSSGNTIRFSVNVLDYPVLAGPPAPSASQHADQMLRWHKQNLPGFSLIDGGDYVIQSRSMSNWNPAYHLTFGYTQPNSGSVNVFQVFVHASERNYVFTLETTPQAFKNALPIAEEMLRSASVTTSSILSAC